MGLHKFFYFRNFPSIFIWSHLTDCWNHVSWPAAWDTDHRTTVYMSVLSRRVYFISPLTPAQCGQEKTKSIAACVTYAKPTIIWSSLHAAQQRPAYYSWDLLKNSHSQAAGDAFMSSEKNQLKGRRLSLDSSNILPLGYPWAGVVWKNSGLHLMRLTRVSSCSAHSLERMRVYVGHRQKQPCTSTHAVDKIG